ncbi:hypothetical protein CRD60_04495 [Bifidobacterium aemilianum]|uniref:Colicin transporter n=1 Tax=Bifidobacterium aemilianum TaxID=2493120 RepID=A0A366K7X3_9BIFI|nr:hypothetical protein [Bifidobacterium aemilianum]RBP97850.1 hypothetical protein CRD60_04495 [Bifidobacterium aemilianum]
MSDNATPSDRHSAQEDHARPRHRPLIIGTALLALALAAAGSAWHLHTSHETALATCQSHMAALARSARDPDTALSRYKDTAATPADQVKDATTVTDMRKAYTTAAATRQTPISCDASPTKDLQDTATKAAEAVIASRDAKSIDDARAALQGKRDEAGTLLTTSEGKVADGTTRETLTTAIQTTDNLLANSKTQLQTLRDGTGPLQAAIDQVNTSIQTKSDTDAAAAAAAQAQQWNAAPSYKGGYQGGLRAADIPAAARFHQHQALQQQDRAAAIGETDCNKGQ